MLASQRWESIRVGYLCKNLSCDGGSACKIAAETYQQISSHWKAISWIPLSIPKSAYWVFSV